MKKLLILTDFSANAMHAVEYGYNLAQQLRANIILCNVITLPTDALIGGTIVWPAYSDDDLVNDSTDELTRVTKLLTDRNNNAAFKPAISAVNQEGSLTISVNDIVQNTGADMIVMATHDGNLFSTLMNGNHANAMIDAATRPLLLVPNQAKTAAIKKIAYATDFTNIEDDLEAIYTLIDLARSLNAEVLIAHDRDEKLSNPEFDKRLRDMLTDISNKANYPHVYYRMIKSRNAESGLDWLCEHGQVDILTMRHKQHTFFENMLKRSHTKKMAEHINIPLLVMHQTNKHLKL